MSLEAQRTEVKGAANGVVRAALMGLCGGMLLGSIYLLFVGFRTYVAPLDCALLSEQECGFAREAALQVGRVQTLSGSALLALGIAVILLLRASKPPPATPPAP